MWIVFEGLDKSGKGTLEKEVLKATNFKHIIIDRGPAGYFVFDAIFERCTDEGILNYAKNLAIMETSKDFVVIYCKVPFDIAMQRIHEHNETCPYDYERAQQMYDSCIEDFYKKQGIKVIEVDTTKSIEECVKIIIEKLQEV